MPIEESSEKHPPAGCNSAPKRGDRIELTIVMPVYNEAEALPSVLEEWIAELARLGMAAELVAYDDGSTDESLVVLEEMARSEPILKTASHGNRGHGPTIMRGYREARGEWVFQIDSDGELGPEAFESLWSRREDFDLLLGSRADRRSSWPRRTVTYLSRAVVALLFGRSVEDVNSPYRLMRRETLHELLRYIPEDCFSPNVLLSGLAGRKSLRILEVPVAHQERRGGKISLTSGRLVRGAFQTFFQALEVSRRARRGAR